MKIKKQSGDFSKYKKLMEVYRLAVSSGYPVNQLDKKIFSKLKDLSTLREMTKQEERKRALKSITFRKVTTFFAPTLLIVVGVFLLSSALLPLLGYYLFELPNTYAASLTAPIPEAEIIINNPLSYIGSKLDLDEDNKTLAVNPEIITEQLDYIKLSNWFDDSEFVNEAKEISLNESGEEYHLDIPKLNISNASVISGSDDLSEGLIQYSASALPGKKGSTVIFGHSMLRRYYRPEESNPNRYKSIFSKIMTLEDGDEIFVTQGEIKYTYIVIDRTEVKPTDIFILDQDKSERRLKLVTCVPEGTYLRRGVVTAQLVMN